MLLVTFQHCRFVSSWPCGQLERKPTALTGTFLSPQAPSVGEGGQHRGHHHAVCVDCRVVHTSWSCGVVGRGCPDSRILRYLKPSLQIYAQLPGPLLCVGSAMAYLTVPCPLGHSCSHSMELFLPAWNCSHSVELFLPVWNSRRCLLSPLVPGRLRQDLLLGRTPPPRPPASACPHVTCSLSLPHLCPDSSHMLNLEQVPSESPSQTCAGERQPHLISSLSNVRCANTAWPVTPIPLLRACPLWERWS